MPVPILFGVSIERVIPDFGDSRGGGTRSHEGQDFTAPKGTPIVSPTEAIVLSTGSGESAGKYVYTANPGGETFRYMHLDTIANIDPGDELSAGDFIGTVGDTGNAPDGVYHLHFEIRDEDNDATDPYLRLTDAFTLKEKMSFLKDVFAKIRNDSEYAEFLVTTFPDEFAEALEKNYVLPNAIEDALEESGLVDSFAAEEKLRALIARIPEFLLIDLEEGDQGPAVQLLQLYLMYTSEGPARDRLLAASATGYFGSVTTAAVVELQAKLGGAEDGVYNKASRTLFLES